MSTFAKQLTKVGPGLLMAGAAIGVSHLVQSTRAGAEFGFQLVALVILVNVLKYPFLEIGPRYALVRGQNMLHAYRELGNWALWVYGVFTAGTMFIIMAALSLFCGSLAASFIPIEIPVIYYAGLVQVSCMLLLLGGKYHLLNSLIRWIMAILFISSISAFLLTLWNGPVANPLEYDGDLWEVGSITFMLALMGWMPIPLDAAVWHSIWAVEHGKELNKYDTVKQEESFSLKDSLWDFNFGYAFAALLSLVFLTLGAFVMYGSGSSFSSTATGFATQLIELYTVSLGSWSYFIIATAAFVTMFSTCLTVMDSIPRVWEAYYWLPKADRVHKRKEADRIYAFTMLTLFGGSMLILVFFLNSFKALIDLATILSFLIAPVLAFINYKVMKKLPEAFQWKPAMRMLALLGIAFLSVFAAIYAYWFTFF